MVRFWDSSALLPLFADEKRTLEVLNYLEDDGDVTVWVLADVELHSALARLGREGRLPVERTPEIGRDVDTFLERATVIDLVAGVRARARRLVRLHPLRAADALQLGAALIACGDEPSSFEFVCLDERLRDAARREGFVVRP